MKTLLLFFIAFTAFSPKSFAGDPFEILYKLTCNAFENGQVDPALVVGFAKYKESQYYTRVLVTLTDVKTQKRVYQAPEYAGNGSTVFMIGTGRVSLSISRQDFGENQPRGNMYIYEPSGGQRSFTLYCKSL